MPNILNVLTNPNKFFEEGLKEEVSLKIPFIVVLILGVFQVISAYMKAGMIMEKLSITEDVASIIAFSNTTDVINAALFPFLIWLIYSGTFYGISILFKGEGGFGRTLEFVGYGFIPSILSGVINLVVTVFYVVPALSKMEFSTENPTLLGQYIQQAMMANPAMFAVFILGILFTIWSANIWLSGMRHARNLSVRDAFVTVAIPVGIELTLTLPYLMFIYLSCTL